MSWDLAEKEKVRISLLLRPSHFTLEKSLESVWNQKKSYKVEIVTDQRLLDYCERIVDCQQQQKAPQSSILSCIRLAENCLFSRGWILKIFVCSTFSIYFWMRHFAKCQKDLYVSSNLCLFTWAEQGKHVSGVLLFCWGSQLWIGARRKEGGGKARVSLFFRCDIIF